MYVQGVIEDPITPWYVCFQTRHNTYIYSYKIAPAYGLTGKRFNIRF